MSSKDEVLTLLADGSEWSAAAIREALPEVKPDTVAWALSGLTEDGAIERIKPGFYRLAAGQPLPAKKAKARNRFTPLVEPQAAPEPEPEPVAEDGATPRLNFAVWDDGDVTLTRGDVSLGLSAADVARFVGFLRRVHDAAGGVMS